MPTTKHTRLVSESSETKVSEAGDGARCSRSRTSSSTGGNILTPSRRTTRSLSGCFNRSGGREGENPPLTSVQDHLTQENSAAIMSLRDLRSLLGYQLRLNTAHTKHHLVYDHEGELQGCVGKPVDPISVAPDMEEEGEERFLINLILAFYARNPLSAAVQSCVNRYDIDSQEFKTLDLPYRVCIQDKRSKRTATNNSLVLIGPDAEPQAESAVDSASDAQPPDLGEVVRIYRMKVGSSDITVEKRTLLLVRRYKLDHVDEELARCGLKGRVWVHNKHKRKP